RCPGPPKPATQWIIAYLAGGLRSVQLGCPLTHVRGDKKAIVSKLARFFLFLLDALTARLLYFSLLFHLSLVISSSHREEASSVAGWRASVRLHADRAAGGHCHHCPAHWPSAARHPEGPRSGRAHDLLEQSQTNRPGLPQPPRSARRLPTG